MEGINAFNRFGLTQLMMASDGSEVKELVSKGAKVNLVDENGDTALHYAIKEQKFGVVRCLLKAGAKNTIMNNSKKDALMIASEFESLDIIQAVARGYNHINSKDYEGNTSLMIAIRHGHLKTVEHFIRAFPSIDVNITDFWGISSLMYACQLRRTEIIKILLESKVDISIVDRQSRNALMHACYCYNSESVEIMLEAGADINFKNLIGDKAIHYANINNIEILISWGADIEATNSVGDRLLHKACRNKNIELIKFLVESGSDFNGKNKEGFSPKDIIEKTLEDLHKNEDNSSDSDLEMEDPNFDTNPEIIALNEILKIFSR